MNCTKCGYVIPEGTAFCPNCGTAVDAAQNPRSADDILGAAQQAIEDASAEAQNLAADAGAASQAAASAVAGAAAVGGAGEAVGGAQAGAASGPVGGPTVEGGSPEPPAQASSAPSYQQEFYRQKQERDAARPQQAQPSYQPKQTWPEQPITKRALAMCFYTGILALIFGFVLREPEDEFLTHHLNQALVLTIGIILSAMFAAVIIGVLLGIFCFVMWIMGMMAAYRSELSELPLIGQIKLVK